MATTKIQSFLNQSQLFVACCSVLLGFESVIISGTNTNFASLSLLFCATLFIYNTSRLIVALQPGENVRSTTITIQGKHIHLSLASFSLVASLLLLTQLELHQLAIFALTACFSLAYMMPFKIRNKRLPGFRNNLIIKNILLASIWTLATCLLPLSDKEVTIFQEPMIWMVARRFFFIYALTAVFDLKDLDADKMDGMKTIARIAGLNGTRIISLLAVIVFSILIFIDPHLTNSAHKNALIISALITAIIIVAANPFRNRKSFVYVVDGAMAIQALLVIAFHFA